MKKLFQFHFLQVLAFVLALFLAPAARAGITNFDALAVGTIGGSTYTALTPAALSYRPFPLSDVKQGDGFSIPASVSIASGVYFGQATGLTNNAALVFPAVDNVSATVSVQIPHNYRSGGVLEALVHYSAVTGIATAVTLTADVYVNTPGSVTSTAKAAGTAVNPAVNSGQRLNWVTLTNSNATYAPGDIASFKLDVDGTSVRVEVLGLRFRYRHYGVIW